jgi:hypothetical protein
MVHCAGVGEGMGEGVGVGVDDKGVRVLITNENAVKR